MIKFYISDLLGKFKKSQRWLADETGIRPSTIGLYYSENIKRINSEDLNAIVKAFKALDSNIKLSDVIDYIDDESSSITK
ncbi:phage-like transcriptional factor [Clostridium pasteurianum DSM 525 = ATCC 6013]|uniref:Phage-like transcriptional factor n=1 Tax=Clostridium pasteurianum DSM 525 = ATCC 6013 TaxID=1262449 RepID=A0A0H3J663_CLOPA|nr:helix-turn-helix transcriptional regulator [Clostridium pasteurianum]AJA48662.1 phage-like transcriptional factor [Clostridium pasteurianum DSM 525 = ATCC 6013]AJA52650.1 phage-like transcriptional factor [Clostridium pasteurianum DSM 525 = ATCC 6013]AOZ75890.1 alkaline phosphatase [Clostridium pasteurianum DSM 525 = ATCC 6013]AOZ79686.1 alkaline phosphatase [Clostridium pasteurianum]ELP59962.1 phage-like transcriptional factor [Clostridium pasteurianum DSM 525 = ATCC 6013]